MQLADRNTAIEIYFISNKHRYCDSMLAKTMKQLSEVDQQRINRLNRWEDRQATLLGRALLLEYNSRNNLTFTLREQLCFSGFRKPNLLNSAYQFSISHCREWVTVCFHKTMPVGIDIEQRTSINIDHFGEFLSPMEATKIRCHSSPEQLFFDIWTRKEAVTKLTGEGLSADLKAINCDCQHIKVGQIEYTAHHFKPDNNHIGHLAYLKCEPALTVTEHCLTADSLLTSG